VLQSVCTESVDEACVNGTFSCSIKRVLVAVVDSMDMDDLYSDRDMMSLFCDAKEGLLYSEGAWFFADKDKDAKSFFLWC